MKRNIKIIKLVSDINDSEYMSYFIKQYLRIARHKGDIENINHTQFSYLKQFGVKFEEIKCKK